MDKAVVFTLKRGAPPALIRRHHTTSFSGDETTPPTSPGQTLAKADAARRCRHPPPMFRVPCAHQHSGRPRSARSRHRSINPGLRSAQNRRLSPSHRTRGFAEKRKEKDPSFDRVGFVQASERCWKNMVRERDHGPQLKNWFTLERKTDLSRVNGTWSGSQHICDLRVFTTGA